MQINNKPDALAGVAFIVIGAAAAVVARNYNVGTASDMGPGFVPVMLGLVLIGLGVLNIISAFAAGDDNVLSLQKIRMRPILCVLGAAVMFAVALKGIRALGIPELGLAPAAFISAFIASLSDPETRIFQAIFIAAILAGMTCLLFIGLLGLPLQYFSFVA